MSLSFKPILLIFIHNCNEKTLCMLVRFDSGALKWWKVGQKQIEKHEWISKGNRECPFKKRFH